MAQEGLRTLLTEGRDLQHPTEVDAFLSGIPRSTSTFNMADDTIKAGAKGIGEKLKRVGDAVAAANIARGTIALYGTIFQEILDKDPLFVESLTEDLRQRVMEVVGRIKPDEPQTT